MPGLKGLIVDTPYIDYILSGEKTWEMRSRNCSIRGLVALIKKGTKTVVGVVNIVDAIGPLANDQLRSNTDKHRLTVNQLDDPRIAKWNNAWVLEHARKLPNPIPYKHPSGAVIWVSLDEETSKQIRRVISSIS